MAHGGVVGRDRLDSIAGDAGIGGHELDFARGVVGTRSATWSSAYPFELRGGGIRAAAGALDTAWVAMLPLGPHSRGATDLLVDYAAAQFEALTARVVGQLYGHVGEARSFAFPSSIGRPPDFPAAVRWLAGEMGLRVGSSYRPPLRKDGGVDVVVWRPFPGGRSGFPVTLVQCTIGSDLRRKARDIDVRMWSGWLALDIEPATALAFPFVVSDAATWDQLSAITTVLDRGRLAALAAAVPSCPRPDWLDEVVTTWREEVR